MMLLNTIGNDLKRSTNRSFAITPEIQLLIALRYFATGAFQVSYFLTFFIKVIDKKLFLILILILVCSR